MITAAVLFTPCLVAAQTPRWTIDGTRIIDPSGAPLRLRGFNVCWWVPPTEADAANIRAMGANCVRYMFGYEPRGRYDPAQLAEVEQQVRAFTKHGLWVVPVLYMFRRTDPADPHKQLDPWSSPDMDTEFLALWTDVIGRLKDDPFVAAWEPLNEPHEVEPAVAAAWYRALIPKLRALDPTRPIVVEGANYSHAEDLTDIFKMNDPNIIYAFHTYYPYEYTTDLHTPPLHWPGRWEPDYLEKTMAPATAFRDRFHVPVWCGEFGCKTGAPGYETWLRDMHGILERQQFDWCAWAWALQPKDPRNDSFDINPEQTGVHDLMQALLRQDLAASPAR